MTPFRKYYRVKSKYKMGYMYIGHLEMIWAVVAVLANNKL
jgi:hypothetical protein